MHHKSPKPLTKDKTVMAASAAREESPATGLWRGSDVTSCWRLPGRGPAIATDLLTSYLRHTRSLAGGRWRSPATAAVAGDWKVATCERAISNRKIWRWFIHLLCRRAARPRFVRYVASWAVLPGGKVKGHGLYQKFIRCWICFIVLPRPWTPFYYIG